mmetsp:Transcript_6885/g.18671  ORF Transcript_6885/g.18671 Transcript_6885/m.18671 type:complete len:250 (-) Transcript_6885:198-947(-)
MHDALELVEDIVGRVLKLSAVVHVHRVDDGRRRGAGGGLSNILLVRHAQRAVHFKEVRVAARSQVQGDVMASAIAGHGDAVQPVGEGAHDGDAVASTLPHERDRNKLAVACGEGERVRAGGLGGARLAEAQDEVGVLDAPRGRGISCTGLKHGGGLVANEEAAALNLGAGRTTAEGHLARSRTSCTSLDAQTAAAARAPGPRGGGRHGDARAEVRRQRRGDFCVALCATGACRAIGSDCGIAIRGHVES